MNIIRQEMHLPVESHPNKNVHQTTDEVFRLVRQLEEQNENNLEFLEHKDENLKALKESEADKYD